MLRTLAERVAEREGVDAVALLHEWEDATAFRRLIEPAEVARTCAWLLSCESSGISGQSIVVDGPVAAGEGTRP
jgi:enoyl-[acyl-carrier-protein] reductase (NADH)